MPFHYQGKLYRALNPVYAREPLSGRGAAIYGGRFNPKGVETLYTSLSVMTALREANQVGNLQPTTLVSYSADIDNLFDSRNVEALASNGMKAADLASNNWRDEMRNNGEAKTQAFARRLINEGYCGLLIRSFAVGAGMEDMNLVLWSWGKDKPCSLVLIDDEGRLSQSTV